MAHLKKDGYNYFTGFRDTHPTHPAGLSYAKVEWASLFPYERDIGQAEIVHPSPHVVGPDIRHLIGEIFLILS